MNRRKQQLKRADALEALGCVESAAALRAHADPEDQETGWQGTTGFFDREELGDDWT